MLLYYSSGSRFVEDERLLVKEIPEGQIAQNDKGEADLITYERVYRSVYYKYIVICNKLQSEKNLDEMRTIHDYRIGHEGSGPYFPDKELVCAFIDLAIQWRNNLVHSGINNKNQTTYKKSTKEKCWIVRLK